MPHHKSTLKNWKSKSKSKKNKNKKNKSKKNKKLSLDNLSLYTTKFTPTKNVNNFNNSKNKQHNASINNSKDKQHNASVKITKFMENTKKKINASKKITDFMKKSKKNMNASKKITKFMKKTESKRSAVFLNSVCKDSGQCIAFGIENDKILKLFNGFTNDSNFNLKDYIVSKKILQSGANGDVTEIKFSRHNYDIYTVLKESIDETSDNLFYEYLTGMHLNEMNKQVPHFVNTYNILLHHGSYSNINDLANNSCDAPTNIRLLIQHIHNPLFIQDLVEKQQSTDLLTTLIQVYFTLFTFSNEFTHYDLHGRNVLLYKPKDNYYIHYHYKCKGYNFSFKSQYLAKIIDFGRSFTKISNNIFKLLLTECVDGDDNYIGDDVGYGWLDPGADKDPDSYYISSLARNMSHDLRLLNEVGYNYRDGSKLSLDFDPELKSVIDNVHYTDRFGTAEHISVPGNSSDNKIYNVNDAFIQLHKLYMTKISDNETFYSNKHKLGDLYIEPGKSVRYISVK